MKRKLKLAFLMLFIYQFTYAQTCLTDWSYVKEITVNNSSNSALVDIPLSIKVNTQDIFNQINPDASDVRFVYDCCTELPYIIESAVNSPNTIFTIRVPNIPANGNLKLYIVYGNALADSNVQKPNLVFDLYEDFTLGQSSSTHFSSPCGVNFTYNLSNNGLQMNWSSLGNGAFISHKKFPGTNDYYIETELANATGAYFYAGIKNVVANSYIGCFAINYSTLLATYMNTSALEDCVSGYILGSSYFSSSNGLFSSLWKTSGGVNQTITKAPGNYNIFNIPVILPKADSQVVQFGALKDGSGSALIKKIKARKYYDTLVVSSTIQSQLHLSDIYSMHNGNDTVTLCDGSTISITPDNVTNFSNFTWSSGETSTNISVNSAGTYTLTADNVMACSISATFIVIEENTNGIISITQVDDSTYTFNVNNAINANIIWDLDNGNTINGSSITHSFAPGTYNICADITTQYGACTYTICAPLTVVDHTSNMEASLSEINLYPNPTSNNLNIELLETSSISIYNLVGQKVLDRSNLEKGLNTIPLENLKTGNYILEINSNTSTNRYNIIKL